MSVPQISVVICTRNRGASLGLTIESLRKTPPSVPWELLVIDNASDDDTQARIRAIESDYPAPLRILIESRIGLAKARNLGLREARSGIVLFLDDDVTCENGVIEAHLRVFTDPAIVCHRRTDRAGPPRRHAAMVPRRSPFQSRRPTARYDFGDEPGEVGLHVGPVPIGAHFGVRREIALELGGFDESLGWGPSAIPGEETRLLDEIRAGRERILYVPDAIVHHRIPAERTTFAYFNRWFERLGRFEALRSGRPLGFARWKGLAQATFRFGKWHLRLLAERDPQRRIAHLRRIARARGRWLELIQFAER